MENIKNITIEDVKNDDKLLEKIIKYYNTYITSQNKYRLANKEKLNEYMKNYYYKTNNKEPKDEKKTKDMKEYQRLYRLKMKQKREENKNLE